MRCELLTQVIADLVNKKETANEYGVAIVNIPELDYVNFIKNLSTKRPVDFFFLGFDNETADELNRALPLNKANYSYSFSIERAEESRNSGDETRFRVLIIRRAEIEKLSSLRWFPEITVDMIYDQSCDYVLKFFKDRTNSVIESLIRALKRKTIRNILGFEHVIQYLNGLYTTDINDLPHEIKNSYYKLGLLQDTELDQGKVTVDSITKRIKRNHEIVDKIGNLEQTERKSITNYYASEKVDNTVPRLILQYYSKKNPTILGKMELAEVENCLKAAKGGKTPPKSRKESAIKPTALASELVFNDNQQQIDEILTQLETDIDERSSKNKQENIELDVEGTKLQIKIEPITEKVSDEMVGEDDFGGIIYADVNSPDEAITDIDKYQYEPFQRNLLEKIFDKLKRINQVLKEGESVSSALDNYISSRSQLLPYKVRLQDAPMFPILAHIDDFKKYLKSYEVLLNALNIDFPRIMAANATKAIKMIINTIISLDNIFVIGEKEYHAIPTPLNPLYLWKYIKLAEEILESKGTDDGVTDGLTEDDKSFIIRKAEDIPDPLSVMLLPSSVTELSGIFLPLAGRIGTLPIYSTNRQINQSESGIEALKQSIIRYLCLYPHAGMMLKLCIIDPPSVELMALMLKKLNNDSEFNIKGIELSIFRTKEATNDWSEIRDESMNDGLIGKVKGNRLLNYQIHIHNKKYSYAKILDKIANDQHILIIFDPNEVKIEVVKNNKQIHIHPLCIPKVYQYSPVDDEVSIRPANEGDVFSIYGSIVEKINEHPSSFSHTSCVFNTPLKKESYEQILKKCDWLVILDQSLKNWDLSLSAASEKLFYREDDYRSIGIYSNNSKKFILGYQKVISKLGNFIPKENGLSNIIQTIRSINDDGLLSIVSHSSNRIFDENHGKGSLGLAIAAIDYLQKYPKAILVGLDTQLAREWLSERDDKYLPDLVGIRLEDMEIDVVEVKTHANNEDSFQIKDDKISGHAVEQSTILEALLKEMFGATERITTVSRREVLRQQVYESLFQTPMEPARKLDLSQKLNSLFAGEYKVSINKQISFVDFENSNSSCKFIEGAGPFAGNIYQLNTIGAESIQAIVAAVNSVKNLEPGLSDLSKERNMGELADSTDPISHSEKKRHDSDVGSTEEPKENVDKDLVAERCAQLNKVLKDYNIAAVPVNSELVQEAARFTRFPVELKSGESIRAIEKAKEDIGIQLEAHGEILVNHIRGTRYISVDIPFTESGKPISLLEHLDGLDGDKQKLNVVIGQSPDGHFEYLDIAKAPHLLVAGTTGSGKTIFLYSIIVSLLHQFSKDEIEFLIIDPKQTDFIFFDNLPNLYGGKVVTDADEALKMLNKINEEDKEERMKQLRSSKSRDINSYNEKNSEHRMKRLVVVIDEYADLIQTAEMQRNRKEFERSLSMLAQKVRSLGIHLIIATQRPSTNIVTGVLKANIPYRVSFRLPSHTDSQTILDMPGAENLLGQGDMLLVTDSDVKRLQGLFIKEKELDDFVKEYVEMQ